MPELKDAINDRECGNTYYQQNTSRRRQPRTDNVKAQSCIGSIVSAGAEEDWRDMWRHSYALIFEALKLVLLISLMII